MRDFFYKPEGAWAADFIPFYRDGRFRLFYLLDWRNVEERGEGTPWYQISTEDFVHFTEHGQMLARGSREEQDLYVFTGSLIEAHGSYHIFYTGHNPHFRNEGRPEQAVMHAVSRDLLQWEKLPADTFYAPTETYEPHDWRDPFVFWNQDAGEYWMLLAARLKNGPSRRQGCTALCSSVDLSRWEVREPFWAPGLYYTHECPDLFRMGDWWYLVYSTFTERTVTHYRMSRSLGGPWRAPENDTFDGRAFYAAKTCSDGKCRFAFGWNPTRDQDRDYAKWHWGGNLVVHQIVQEPDGTLGVRAPDPVDEAFASQLPVSFSASLGEWQIAGNRLSVSAPGSFACAMAQPLPSRCKINATITFGENTRGCGVALRTSEDLEKSYYIRLEPGRDRLVFDAWPRNGDCPLMVELERPVRLLPGQAYEMKIFVDGTVCEVYLNGKVAMSGRLYDLKQGRWGVFVNEGRADFEDVQIGVSQMQQPATGSRG
jgi:beta-fructofuranosidase